MLCALTAPLASLCWILFGTNPPQVDKPRFPSYSKVDSKIFHNLSLVPGEPSERKERNDEQSGFTASANGFVTEPVPHKMLEAIGNEHTHPDPGRELSPRLSGGPHRHILKHVCAGCQRGGVFRNYRHSFVETMEDVRRLVTEYTEKTKSDFEALTDRHLNETISWGHYHATGEQWLISMRDRKSTTKGNLSVRPDGRRGKASFFTVRPPKK